MRLKQLGAKGDFARRKALQLILAGGMLPRRKEAGLSPSATCHRCGASGDDEYRCIWGCRKNEGQAFEKSKPLERRAERGHRQSTAFWLRGLIPESMLEPWAPPLHHNSVSEGRVVDLTFLPGVGPWEEAVLLFGDASGGPYSSIKRFRAVGCALVQLEPSDFSEVASHTWTLVHDEQAVPRGELECLLVALITVGEDVPLIYITDSSSVKDGWDKDLGPGMKMSHENRDLWCSVHRRRRRAPTTVLKVESHVCEEDMRLGYSLPLLTAGNDAADKHAGARALELAPPEGRVRHYDTVLKEAKLIQERAMAAMALAIEAAPPHEDLIVIEGAEGSRSKGGKHREGQGSEWAHLAEGPRQDQVHQVPDGHPLHWQDRLAEGEPLQGGATEC